MGKKIKILMILALVAALGLISAIPGKDTANQQPQNSDYPPKQQQKNTGNMSIALAPAQKVEVFMFHRTQRCATCIAIGKLSGQTVQEYFAQELKNGKIEFREINIDDAQNKYLAEKFQAAGSGLFINAIRDDKDNIQEDINVWRLTGDENAFKNYLADEINGLLGK